MSIERSEHLNPTAATASKKDTCGSEHIPRLAGNVHKQASCCNRPVNAAADGAGKTKVCSSSSSSSKEIAATDSNDSGCDGEMGESSTSGTLLKAAGCCARKSTSNTSGEDARAETDDASGQPCKESQERFGAVGRTLAENAVHKDPCCKSKSDRHNTSTSCSGMSSSTNVDKDLCCSSIEEEEKSAQGFDRDHNAGAESMPCSGKCCASDRRNVSGPDSACLDHLQSAYDRFEFLIRLGRCLCRKMIEEFNFCCCCGQASPCSSHKSRTNVPPENANETDPCCKPTRCAVRETAKATGFGCKDAYCSSGKEARTATTIGMDTHCVLERAAQSGRSSCEDACCARAPNANSLSSTCVDACCTQTTRSAAEPPSSTLRMSKSTEVDVERAAAREHVVLSVSGMTCTGCSKKMLNVLANIPGVSGPIVTFVSGSAAFDFDRSVGDLNNVLALIEKRTGFKMSRATGEFQELDVLLDVADAEAFRMNERFGLVSFEKVRSPHEPCWTVEVRIAYVLGADVSPQTKAKNTYRVVYDPRVVGARDLLPYEAKLPPPDPDAANSEGRKRLISMAWATFLAAIFTIPVVVLSWADTPVPQQTRQIISFVLATIVQAIAVPEFYVGAIISLIFSKVVEMDMLVVISITAAYGYSVVAFALAERGIRLEQKAFFETSSLLITLVLLGRLMAAFARMRAVSAVSISSLQAETALLLHANGETEEIDARLLQIGDTIRVMAHTSVVT